MTPASKIIERCGGFKVVADWLGLDRSAVQRWTYEHPKGTGEQVPLKHWTPLIEAAAQAGVEIKPSELMPPEVAEAAFAEAQASAAA
jgi:hypothetical protein